MAHPRWPCLLALAALIGAGGPLVAGDLYPDKAPVQADSLALPRPADVQSLSVHPAKVVLKGLDDANQLVLTASLPTGRLQDLTGEVRYEVANSRVARVTSTGRVIPVANGST